MGNILEKRINLKKLNKQIEIKRVEMIKIAKEKGFNSKETIDCSQELDVLLLKYQKSFYKR